MPGLRDSRCYRKTRSTALMQKTTCRRWQTVVSDRDFYKSEKATLDPVMVEAGDHEYGIIETYLKGFRIFLLAKVLLLIQMPLQSLNMRISLKSSCSSSTYGVGKRHDDLELCFARL